VEDVDLDNKRARTTSKGGDTEWRHFQSGSARLLPRIIAGRQTGPLFLADRRPAPARTPPAAVDVCPVTGRGRLSYERAEYLFKQHSRRISHTGLTLHQLRHSALTTLADANVSLPLLMGKSRHKNLRSLQRYVHPSARAGQTVGGRGERGAADQCRRAGSRAAVAAATASKVGLA